MKRQPRSLTSPKRKWNYLKGLDDIDNNGDNNDNNGDNGDVLGVWGDAISLPSGFSRTK
jgi:hypothetical protein